MPTSTRRALHRRSSCSSIPRSVSTCSSLFDSRHEDFRDLADVREMYMAPLFRGPEGIGTTHKAREQMSSIPPGSFTPRVKATPYDDSLSDNLSNYQFEIAGYEQGSETLTAPEGNVSRGQSPARAHPKPSLPFGTHPTPKASRPHLPADPVSRVDFLPPPLPPKVTKPIPQSTSTRPLQINRSKDRKQLANSPQQTVPRGVQYGRPAPRPIYRAATEYDLHNAYVRASPLAEQKTHARGPKPTLQPPLHRHHENSSPNAKNAPISTLFSTDLISLEHARERLKHINYLEHPNHPTNPSTPPQGNRSPRPSLWPLSRAFKRHKG